MQTKGWIGLGAAVVLLSIGLSWFWYEQSSAYTRLCISLDSRNVPFTKVKIQGHHYNVKFYLGSKLPLSLNKTVLARLEKKDAGKVKIKTLDGNEVELQAFHLKKIALGDLVFKDVLAVEMDGENDFGFIGRPLLVKYNLLFDFNEATVLMSNRFKNIERAGYGRVGWVQAPIEVGRTGVVLQADTDIGATKFSLNPATPDSVLTSSRVGKTQWKDIGRGAPCFTTSTFMIGGNEFGSRNLYSLPISNSEFSKIDGILGMDFLNKHIVYLDFDKQCAYIAK